MKVIYYLGILFFLVGCINSNNQSEKYSGPLKPFFTTWDELSTSDFHIEELNKNYYLYLGQNNEELIDRSLKDLNKAHTEILEKITQKHPKNSVKLAFEQKDKQIGTISNLVLSDYFFPWSTATRLAYRINFDIAINSDNRIMNVRFEFLDKDDDIFMSSNCTVTKSGTYTVEIRPEVDFYHFRKVIVTVK